MLSFQRKERERKTKYKTLRRFLRWCKFEYKQTNKKTLPETFGGTLCCCYWFICLLCGEESLPRSALRTYLSQHIKSNRMCQTQWNVTQKSLHRLHYLICLIVSVGRFWWSSFGAITSHMHFTFCFFFFLHIYLLCIFASDNELKNHIIEWNARRGCFCVRCETEHNIYRAGIYICLALDKTWRFYNSTRLAVVAVEIELVADGNISYIAWPRYVWLFLVFCIVIRLTNGHYILKHQNRLIENESRSTRSQPQRTYLYEPLALMQHSFNSSNVFFLFLFSTMKYVHRNRILTPEYTKYISIYKYV